MRLILSISIIRVLAIIVGGVGAAFVGQYLTLTYTQAAAPGYNGDIYYLHRPSVEGEFTREKMDADGANPTVIPGLDGTNTFDFSPDGSRIAFQYYDDEAEEAWIAVSDLDGSNRFNLTDGNSPNWHPGGLSLFFEKGNCIATINIDGTEESELLGCNINTPVWSPDGQSVAFSQCCEFGGTRIVIADADMTNWRCASCSPARLGRTPQWSPDGKKIAFRWQSAEWSYGDRRIGIVDVETGEFQDVSASPISIKAFDGGPRWSPDGKKVVFYHGHNEHNTDVDIASPETIVDIVSVGIENGEVEFLTNNEPGQWKYNPAWQQIPNTAPATALDKDTTPFNTIMSIDVLANDTDEEALDPQYLTIATQPFNGTAEVTEGKIRYSPNSGFHGLDELTYQICDSFLLDQKCSIGVLAVTVAAPNAPSAILNKVGSLSFNPSTNSYQTIERRPTFSGTADPFAEIRIEIHSDPIVLTTTADENGNWSATPDQDLPVGEHTVYITATKDGVTTELDSFILAITQELPATGADITALRTSGALLIASGLGIMLYRRGRKLIQ